MFLLIAILAMILSVVLIAMVLLQPSKSGAVGGMLGTVSSSLGSTFGSRRTLDFLAKGTTYVAAGLGVLCLLANFVLSDDTVAAGRRRLSTEGKSGPTAPAPAGVDVPPPTQGAQPSGAEGGAQQPQAAPPQGTGTAPAGTPPAQGDAQQSQPATPPAGQ